VLSEEVQLAGAMSVVEFFEEAAAEVAREHTHRQEEASLAGDPAILIQRQSTAGDDAVDMGMVSELGAPGVQDQCHADARAEVARSGGDRAQRLGGEIEQQAINDLLVGVGDVADEGREGEDHVVVVHGQQVRSPSLEPASRGAALALGAVAVATGVVGDLGLRTGRAAQHVPTQSGAATALDGGHDLELQEAQVPALLLSVARSVGAEDLRDLRHEGDLRGSGGLQRRDDLAQDLGGYLSVECRGLELLVAEQDLDDADVDLLLEQVGGKAVSKCVHRDALVDASGDSGSVHRTVELPRAQGFNRVQAWEQPPSIKHLAL
jgi:hypothetical protein